MLKFESNCMNLCCHVVIYSCPHVHTVPASAGSGVRGGEIPGGLCSVSIYNTSE